MKQAESKNVKYALIFVSLVFILFAFLDIYNKNVYRVIMMFFDAAAMFLLSFIVGDTEKLKTNKKLKISYYIVLMGLIVEVIVYTTKAIV